MDVHDAILPMRSMNGRKPIGIAEANAVRRHGSDADVRRRMVPRIHRSKGHSMIQSDIAACGCQRGPAWRNIVLWIVECTIV